ncbi:MAG TPA: sigma-54-dependent Fis family transcriptional regulator [Deltaproteobacteria bacterium]|nr:sigma-54-dependent Fis family transcriptional regulator [Deltaproteobacteria bacterium]
MNQGKILAIDDEKNIRYLIRKEFSLEGFEVVTAASGEEGLKLLNSRMFNIVLLDIKLPGLSGIEILKQIKQKSPATEVIMMTGYGDIRTAVESIKLGACDYITKPFKLDELLALVKQAVKEKNRDAGSGEKTGDFQKGDDGLFIRCSSPAMQKVYELVDRIAPTDHTVLISGETGAGKDVLAYEIHRKSLRQNGPFVTLDCGMLTQSLAESELYGHRKGAFSGASEAKPGLVEKSNKGTLFLDEIGNIDESLQKKFLRFLETKQIRRVGETMEVRVDTRIILATHLDLEEAVKKGVFRNDLFYRIAMFNINILPLRDRPEDIVSLAKHFLNQFTANSCPKRIAPEVNEALISYPWPGNVRELRSVISKAALMSESDSILLDDLPRNIIAQKTTAPHRPKTLENMEKEHILAVLAKTGGNQTQAAQILCINRKTLYKKIHNYKIFS